MSTNSTVMTSQNKTKELVIDALFIALTFVATMFINIRLPLMGNGGLIHLGNVPMFLGAFIYGKRTGALAGGIGMGLFDLISGWTAWAPFTLVIVGLCFGNHFRQAEGSSDCGKHDCGDCSADYQNCRILFCGGNPLRKLGSAAWLDSGEHRSGSNCRNHRDSFCG